jgi:hypothetical protein
MDGGDRDPVGGEHADAEDLARKLRLRARARADGLADRPGPDSLDRAGLEEEILATVSRRQDGLADQAAADAERLMAKLAAAAPPVDGAGLAITSARLAVRQAAGRAQQELASVAARAQRTAADLMAFRQVHRRDSEAEYPASVLLAFGLLAIAALFEASFSATLFAQEDAHGLLGGAATAVGLAGANVSIGFLGGFLGLRYLQHVRLVPRIVGAVCFAVALLAALTLNGFAALWRQDTAHLAQARADVQARAAIVEDDGRCMQRARGRSDPEAKAAAAQACENTRRAALSSLTAGQTGLAQQFSPQALVLLMLGLGVWTFSVLKGFNGIDDPYPNYGKLDRIAQAAEAELLAVQQDLHAEMKAALKAAEETISSAVRRQEEAVGRMRQAYNTAGPSLTGFESKWRRWDRVAGVLISQYQADNAAARRAAVPAHFGLPVPRRSPPRDPLEVPGQLLADAQAALSAAQASARQELDALLRELEGLFVGMTKQAVGDGATRP